jgi:hypothetical protein
MARPSLLVPALVTAALLWAAPVAPAATKEAGAEPPFVKFHLPANNGLHARFESANGNLTLELQRKGHFASYETAAEITEAGVEARFGGLGSVAVAFKPTRTLRTDEPPKGCEGEPSTHREGLFEGTIEFDGERRFVHIEATRAEGRMSVYRESEWRCPKDKSLPGHDRPPRPPIVNPRRRAEEGKEPATLYVFSRRCRCGMLALAEHDRRGRGPTIVYGVKQEQREGMEINRATYAKVGSSAFAFDHAAGTASLNPPPPFSGHASFERRPHGRDAWRSTIRIPLLGSAPIGLSGRSFRARLVRDLPGD